jgi:hypothetical protein
MTAYAAMMPVALTNLMGVQHLAKNVILQTARHKTAMPVASQTSVSHSQIATATAHPMHAKCSVARSM